MNKVCIVIKILVESQWAKQNQHSIADTNQSRA